MALEILPKGLGRHACTHAGGRGVRRQKLKQSWRTSVHIKKIGRNYAPAYGQQVCNNFTECEGGPLACARGSERCSVFRVTMALRPTQNKEDASARGQGRAGRVESIIWTSPSTECQSTHSADLGR